MFHEFVISVTHIQGNEYLIRTEKVEPYVPITEERKIWALDQWLTQAKTLMSDPVLLSLKENGKNNKSPILTPKQSPQDTKNTQQALIKLGQNLYEALFSGSLRESLYTAQSLAQKEKCLLRFRLALKHDPLLSLPWEVLHPTGTDSFRPLVTGTEVAFSRYHHHKFIKNTNLIRSRIKNESLKILIVISSPDDQEKLALKKEVKHLENELKEEKITGNKDILLTVLENPSREELTQALEQRKYHVFHYAGHSDIGRDGGDIYLVNRRTGLTESLSGKDLAGLLANNEIQLAVFNSCRSGEISFGENNNNGKNGNLAQAIVERGIPAVLAMVAPIPDQVALTFTRLVYRNLNLGYAIDVSLSRSRQGLISAYGSNQLYWALPVLYLHPEFDGILIEDNNNQRDPQNFIGENNQSFSSDEISYNRQSIPTPPPFPNNNDAELLFKEDLTNLAKQIDNNHLTKTDTNNSLENNNITSLKPLKILSIKKISQKVKVIVIGIGSIVILLIVLFWYGQNPVNKVEIPPSNPTNPLNLDEVTTANVTAIAIEKFSQGNLEQGSLAVKKLLDQGLLPYAKSALIQVDPAQLTDPEINFLFGRLAWQYHWQENEDFTLDDVSRYWELAVKENPNSIEYYNGLGFLYYARNDLERANEALFKALDLINSNPDTSNLKNMDRLNTYAGLALVLRKSAENYSGKQRQDLINQSLAYREKVMKNDAMKFQGETLAKPENWLWFESAIQDWQTFLEIQPKNN
jgi:tetratricopeptide (TPR) repeat protein